MIRSADAPMTVLLSVVTVIVDPSVPSAVRFATATRAFDETSMISVQPAGHEIEETDNPFAETATIRRSPAEIPDGRLIEWLVVDEPPLVDALAATVAATRYLSPP